MKTILSSILFLTLFSCKKENVISNNHQKDSTKLVSITPETDSSTVSEHTEEIFTFTTELCDNKAQFDSAKYSKEELEGTYKLWFELGGVLLSTPSVFNLNSLQKVRTQKDEILAQLDKDFAIQKNILENLKVVKDPYWENIKSQKIRELKDEYEFRKTEILAFSDPSILMNHRLSKNCENFVKALNSDETEMIREWRKLREEMSKRNGNPQRIIDEFEEHLHSPDRKDYATIDLITFGWGNCANDGIKRIDYDENMNKKFNSLFLKIDSECDEP